MPQNGIYWGVDSYKYANRPYLPNKPILYDYIKAEVGKPEFFGRYIGGGQGRYAGSLTKDERDWLLAKDCPILLVYSAGSEANFNATGGRNAALNAINAAKQLGVPRQVCIYANIEPSWKPSINWILGWMQEMWKWKQPLLSDAGGFYCSPSDITKSFTSPFRRAAELFLGSLTKASPIPLSSPLCLLWANSPQHSWSPPPPSGKDQPRYDFKPDTPQPRSRRYLINSVVAWQYLIKCHTVRVGVRNDTTGKIEEKKDGLFDMDTATELGYKRMWLPNYGVVEYRA